MKTDSVSLLSTFVVTGMTIASGVMHGRMRNTYDPTAAADVAHHLQEIPNQVGKWQLTSSHDFDDHVVDVLECAGYIVRTFVDEERDQTVAMFLICGPPGPTAVHTPEICYDGRGQTIREQRTRVHMETSTGLNEEFWTLTFQSNDIDEELTRVYYAWSAGNRWQAPEQPRVSFAQSKHLYKIQLAAVVAADTDFDAYDPCRDFLRDFLPVASKYLRSQD